MRKLYALLLVLCVTAQFVHVASGQTARSGSSSHVDAKTVLRKLSGQPTNRELLAQLLQVIASERNSQEKARLTTIYAIGTLLAGQSEHWQKATDYLLRQHPKSEWLQLFSADALSGTCPHCEGVGYKYDPCNRCKGNGKCGSCEGKGSREIGLSKTKQTCSICEGSGHCGACEGSGKTKSQCYKCRGAGIAYSAEEARGVYRKLLGGGTAPALIADMQSRMAKRKTLIDKNKAEREKERAYGLAINSLDEQSLKVQLRVLKVFDDAILASGYCRTYAMPQQFWVTGIGARLVDGDRWQGDVYNVGRLSITTPDGVPYTFRVFCASKEEAAKAIVEASMPETEVAPVASSESAHASNGGSTGTGWFCKGGYIVTCYHVVQGHDRLSVVVPGVGQFEAQLVQSDSANDIALLKPSGLANMPLGLPLAQKAPAMGDAVFTLGFPHTDLMGKSIKLSDGIVSSLTGYRDDPRTLQISVPIQSGNSGGPLLNAQGEVVGIVAAKLAAAEVFRWTGDMPQNVNYAIKTGYLNLLLDAVPANQRFSVRQPAQASLGEVARDAATAIVLVVAE